MSDGSNIRNAMNKGRRQEVKQLKYKKRLAKIGVNTTHPAINNPRGEHNGTEYNYTGYRNSSKPCSCSFCTRARFGRAHNKSEGIREFRKFHQ